MNLCELRSVLTEGARVAPAARAARVVTARHVADATDRVGRAYLWRACEMMLRGGGRLYVEFAQPRAARTTRSPATTTCARCPCDGWSTSSRTAGATVVSRTVTEHESPDVTTGHRIGRLVVEWQR